jgi:hypothetical protein
MVPLPDATPGVGVNSAVYTSGLAVRPKPLRVPPPTLISPSAKPTGASLKLKVMTADSPIFRLARCC